MTRRPALRRVVTLPLLVLYGLGVTIGAGIYVLIGATVAEAGMFAPTSFLLAAVVMGFTALSFAELSGRRPEAAGEAAYVDAAFGRPWLTLAVGLGIVLSAVVAAAAITLGGAGYVLALVPVPGWVAVTCILVLMTAIAAWGVLESVTFAAALTVLEIAGLLVIVFAGLWSDPGIVLRLPEVIPPLSDAGALGAVFGASLIAFFAFIGFDDVVNLVEETKTPARIMPLGILLTLGVATAIYFMVVSVAVLTTPTDLLAGSGAPISVLFERLTGLPPLAITLIAIVATLNGIVIQIIMAARVLYGLSNAGRLPGVFARINPVTRTPLASTLLIGGAALALALIAPIGALAQATTQIVLTVFVLVNLSLLIIKARRDPAPAGAFLVPIWAPACGALASAGLLIGPLFT